MLDRLLWITGVRSRLADGCGIHYISTSLPEHSSGKPRSTNRPRYTKVYDDLAI